MDTLRNGPSGRIAAPLPEPEVVQPHTRIVLLGLMGAGKSTVGRSLSQLTGWPYLDNDELVEELAGASKDTLLKEHGEPTLRRYERLALDRVLSDPAPLIGSVAGGALLQPDAVDELVQSKELDAYVVWLRVPHATLVERLKSQPDDRPWLQGDPSEAVARLAAVREPIYERCADRIVDTLNHDAAEVAADILAVLRGTTAPV